MDFLFWRTEEQGLPKHQRNTYTWIIWYIWKTIRNDKVFNGKDISPVDTIQLAKLEEEIWKFAVQNESVEEEEEGQHTEDLPLPAGNPHVPTCQINAF